MGKRTTSVPAEAGRLYMLFHGRYDKSNPIVFETPVIVFLEIEYAGQRGSEVVEVVAVWPSAGSITVRETARFVTEKGPVDGFHDRHVYDWSTDGADAMKARWNLANLEMEVNRVIENQ